MPALPRNIEADLARKLGQLEAGAEGLERDAKNAVSADILLLHREAWARDVLWGLTLRSWVRPVWVAYRHLLGALGLIDRTARNPHLATALRFGRGWVRETVPYVAAVCGVMLAIALLIALLAPPD
jgi:hypothetical protein